MSINCAWLHNTTAALPIYHYPFATDSLPDNGIYFLYETNEIWGHGGILPRIVRVGSSKEGNFRSRINEHFLMNREGLSASTDKPKFSDRSIFRKNIGRAILNRRCDAYLPIWEKDFTNKLVRIRFGAQRDLHLESDLENQITEIIRRNFSLSFIEVTGEANRLGQNGYEAKCIATLASCADCKPSANWLGNSSPIYKIRQSGLWQTQHLRGMPLSSVDIESLSGILLKT